MRSDRWREDMREGASEPMNGEMERREGEKEGAGEREDERKREER